MLSLDYIRLIWDYNYWAQHKLLDSIATISHEDFIRPVEYSMGSLHEQIIHTMWAEALWLSRSSVGKTFSSYNPSDYPTLDAIRQKWASIEADWRAFLASLNENDLDRHILVMTTEGTQFNDVLGQMLIHVVNHGTDHRAQMLNLIHSYGGITFEQDMIRYFREKNVSK